MKSKSLRSTVRVLSSVLVLILALRCVGASAQPATGDSARVFILNSLESDQSINILLDDKIFVQDDTTVSNLIEKTIAVGEHTLTATEYGTGNDAPLFAPIQATLEAGNNYLLYAGGALELNTGDAFFDLIPLGQSLAPDAPAPRQIVVANHVEGLPAVDLALDGKVVATDVASGETVIEDAPLDSFSHETWSDPKTGDVLLEQDYEDFPLVLFDNTLAVLILHGKYPGEAHEAYDSWLLPPIYIGEITTVDGPEIHSGDKLVLELEAGQRIRYPMTLDKTTNIDVRLLGASQAEDAYLRVYDAAGNLVEENDELTYGDDTFDAGLTEITLKAGTYLVEAASWGDVFPGSFTLTVK